MRWALLVVVLIIFYICFQIQQHKEEKTTTDEKKDSKPDAKPDDMPQEVWDFLNQDPEHLLRDILPMPEMDGANGGKSFEPAPPENQAVDANQSTFDKVTKSVLNFVDCATGSNDCVGEFEQGKMIEPPKNSQGGALAASITTGIAPWNVVTFFKMGVLTEESAPAKTVTNINTSPISANWLGRETADPPRWIGPTALLEDAEFVTGFDIGFEVHAKDLIVVSMNYRASGTMQMVIQDSSFNNVANILDGDGKNATDSPFQLHAAIELQPMQYRLRIAVINAAGPAALWIDGSLASVTPNNLLITE